MVNIYSPNVHFLLVSFLINIILTFGVHSFYL